MKQKSRVYNPKYHVTYSHGPNPILVFLVSQHGRTLFLPALMSFSLARSSPRILQAVCSRSRPPHRHALRHFTPEMTAIPRRAFTSTSPRPIQVSARPQIEPAVLLSHPSPQDLEEAEIDAELIPPREAVVKITDRAAHVRRTFLMHSQPLIAVRRNSNC